MHSDSRSNSMVSTDHPSSIGRSSSFTRRSISSSQSRPPTAPSARSRTPQPARSRTPLSQRSSESDSAAYEFHKIFVKECTKINIKPDQAVLRFLGDASFSGDVDKIRAEQWEPISHTFRKIESLQHIRVGVNQTRSNTDTTSRTRQPPILTDKTLALFMKYAAPLLVCQMVDADGVCRGFCACLHYSTNLVTLELVEFPLRTYMTRIGKVVQVIRCLLRYKQALSDNTTIKRLNLRQCRIGDVGFRGMSAISCHG